MSLSLYEQETIINFKKDEKLAFIFTYEKTWQRHLEKRLGLKPIMDNGHGGREYQIDKKRIPMPRAPRKLSPEQKKALTDRLPKRHLNRENTNTVANQRKKGAN